MKFFKDDKLIDQFLFGYKQIHMLKNYGKTPVAQTQPIETQFIPKQHTKQQLRQWQSTFNLIHLLLKNHNRSSLSSSFNKLRKYQQIKKKYSSFLLNKLHLLQKRKCREYIKLSFSALQSNRINFYTTKKQQSDKIKQFLKNKAVSLMIIISTKLQKLKKKTYFSELKIRGQLKSKFTTFKTTHLFSRLNSLYQDKLKQSLFRISAFVKKKLQILRRTSRLQKFITTKTKNYLLNAFLKLRINVFQLKGKEEKQKQQKKQEVTQVKPQKQVVNNDKETEAEIRKLQNQQKVLNQKKKNLEKQYSKLEADSQRMLNDFKKQIKRLQNENEELGFNNGILQQNNKQLQRQLQNRQKSTRKKLSKSQIWQNVYNNLIHFLTINKDKEVTKAALLQALQLPLVPCNINIDQLNDQNQVLTELLQQYKKNFPAPQNLAQNEPQLLPFDVIRKQNRYYYMVLQVLSQWGISGSKELQQLNNDLTTLQKKLS